MINGGDIVRITIGIDDKVMKELVLLTAAKNKTEAINIAIRDFLQRKAKKSLLKMRGKLHLENNWKKLREAEIHENNKQ
jgi:Arc/MetJ family transcription regulator